MEAYVYHAWKSPGIATSHRSEAVIDVQPHPPIKRELDTFEATCASRSRVRSRKSDRTRSSAFSAEEIEAAERTALVPRRKSELQGATESH